MTNPNNALLQQALVSNAVAYRYRFKNDLQWQYTESLAQATQPCEIQHLYIAQPDQLVSNLDDDFSIAANNAFAKMYADNADRIEIERLKMVIESMQPELGKVYISGCEYGRKMANLEASLSAIAQSVQPAEADNLLTELNLDPDTYRTDGGWLNIPKIKAAIANPDDYPRLELTHEWRNSASYGGEICATCGAVKGTGRGLRRCAIAQPEQPTTPKVTP